MSSKRGKAKRTKHVRNLDSDDASSQSKIEEHHLNIPAGRQLHRTPPCKSERVTIHLLSKPDGSPTSEQAVKDEPWPQEIAEHVSQNGSNEEQHERKSIRRSSSIAASATTGDADPESFIQGMQGYQWTDADLEFVYETKKKKQVQQAQLELSEVQKSLKRMRQMRDLAIAAHDKIQSELSKLPSREWVQQVSMKIILRTQSSPQLEELDLKALLDQLKLTDVISTIAEEKTEVSKLKTEVEKAQAMREKEEQLTKDIESYKENINRIKVNACTLTAEIAALESQLSCKEEAPRPAKPRQKISKDPQSSASSTVTKAPAAPKASKRSSAASAPKRSKPSIAASAPNPSKPSSAASAPNPSKPSSAASAPKPSKPSAVPKPPKTIAALKPSKSSAAPSAPKPSKPPATLKDSKTPKFPKPTAGPKAPEGDVTGLRRSKRIASEKEK